MTYAIEIDNLSFRYYQKNVLEEIDLKFEEGKFFSIIGPNGSGKTTLLKLIIGLLKPTTGEIKILGEKICKNNIYNIRRIVGYVPQYIHIDKKFPATVKEVVSIGRISLKKMCEKISQEDECLIEKSMDIVGIKHLFNRKIGELSGGELQKVLISIALVKQPKIFLLDEPTSNLDLKSQNEILEVIENIYKKEKITTIFVTHLLSHIPKSCKNVVLLKNKRIFYSGDLEGSINLLPKLYDYPIEVGMINGRIHIHIGKEKIHLEE